MIKTYKYRIYPTKKQTVSLESQLEGHRLLYNQALAQKKEVYELTGKGLGYTSQAKELLPKLRKENGSLALCNYSSLQQTLRRLDRSYNDFFRRIKINKKAGYPRLKSAARFNTITYSSFGDGCQIKENRLYLQNVGCIKVKWHRPIDGNIKTLSVTRRNNKWYVLFVVEYTANFLPAAGKVVGIDVGLNAFVTTSDGIQIFSPKFFRHSERKLAEAQRLLSQKKKGSARKNKARVIVAKHHEKISNQRLDFCHKVSHWLVKNYDGFSVENLNIKNMVKNKHLSKSISDAGWGIFFNILKSKAESAGRWYQEIIPAGTSQKCSRCSSVVKKSLALRIHNCPYCGLSLDRDVNAALNILKKAWIEPSLRGGALMPFSSMRS